MLVIENVGNLVCTAGFDLGERLRLVVLSVAEGDDKAVKYPAIFQGSDALIITKMDLSPYMNFDPLRIKADMKRLNPTAPVFEVAALHRRRHRPAGRLAGGRKDAETRRGKTRRRGDVVQSVFSVSPRLPSPLFRPHSSRSAAARPAAKFSRATMAPPKMKNTAKAAAAERASPVMAFTVPKRIGPRHDAALLDTLKKPMNSAARLRGVIMPIAARLTDCVPPSTNATAMPSSQNCACVCTNTALIATPIHTARQPRITALLAHTIGKPAHRQRAGQRHPLNDENEPGVLHQRDTSTSFVTIVA